MLEPNVAGDGGPCLPAGPQLILAVLISAEVWPQLILTVAFVPTADIYRLTHTSALVSAGVHSHPSPLLLSSLGEWDAMLWGAPGWYMVHSTVYSKSLLMDGGLYQWRVCHSRCVVFVFNWNWSVDCWVGFGGVLDLFLLRLVVRLINRNTEPLLDPSENLQTSFPLLSKKIERNWKIWLT